MTAPEIPANVLAAVGRHRVELAELVAGVREHADAFMCELPGACPGGPVQEALHEMAWQRQQALLALALAELAALGYGLPVHLTDAALAALDVPKGGDDDRDR